MFFSSFPFLRTDWVRWHLGTSESREAVHVCTLIIGGLQEIKGLFYLDLYQKLKLNGVCV